MMKTGFVFLAFIWSSFSFAVAEVDVSKTVEICKDESRPILFYSDLFSAPNDSNELYLDRFKDQLKGLWLKTGATLTLSGLMTSKDTFYLCSYDELKGKQPLEKYTGRFTGDGVVIIDSKNITTKIPFAPSFLDLSNLKLLTNSDFIFLSNLEIGNFMSNNRDLTLSETAVLGIIQRQAQSVFDSTNRIVEALDELRLSWSAPL